DIDGGELDKWCNRARDHKRRNRRWLFLSNFSGGCRAECEPLWSHRYSRCETWQWRKSLHHSPKQNPARRCSSCRIACTETANRLRTRDQALELEFLKNRKRFYIFEQSICSTYKTP